jgi:phosphoglycolate phosphatase-like HAD superfamily hydrolase
MNVKEMIGRLRDLDKIIVESPPSIYAEAADMLAELLEENARLRKDAERYRWLFADEHTISGRFNQVYRQWNGEDGTAGFTSALDAAMKERK